MYKTLVFCLALAAVTFGQTRMDLQRQGKEYSFLLPPFNQPIRIGATLPQSCETGELYFLTSAGTGGNLYGCTAGNIWTPQGSLGEGAISVRTGGSLVGTSTQVNFEAGPGTLVIASDSGSQINIEQTVDTAMVETKAASQSGLSLFCDATSADGTVYTCGMMPMLGQLTEGMVIHWRPGSAVTGTVPTLNVDGLGAIAIRRPDGLDTPEPGSLRGGDLYALWYDGTVWRLSDAPVPADYQTKTGEQSGESVTCRPAGGSGSSYSCGLNPPLQGLVQGTSLRFIPDVDSAGGPTTIAIDGLPAVPLKAADGQRDLQAGELRAGELLRIWFDGTAFRLVSIGSLPRYVAKQEWQNGEAVLCRSTGSLADAYSCVLNPTLSGYSEGMVIRWIPDQDAAGPGVTLEIDGLGAKPVKQRDGVRPVNPANVRAGQLQPLWYDGTQFRTLASPWEAIQTSARPACEATIRGTLWIQEGSAGVADELAVCAKDAGDAFDWRVLY